MEKIKDLFYNNRNTAIFLIYLSGLFHWQLGSGQCMHKRMRYSPGGRMATERVGPMISATCSPGIGGFKNSSSSDRIIPFFLTSLLLASPCPTFNPPTRNAISAGRSVGGEASRAVARRFPPLIEEVLAIPALKRSLRPSECIMASISSLPFTAMGQVAERRAPAGSGFRSSGFSAVSFSGFRGRVETSGPQMVVRCVAATGGEVVIV